MTELPSSLWLQRKEVGEQAHILTRVPLCHLCCLHCEQLHLLFLPGSPGGGAPFPEPSQGSEPMSSPRSSASSSSLPRLDLFRWGLGSGATGPEPGCPLSFHPFPGSQCAGRWALQFLLASIPLDKHFLGAWACAGALDRVSTLRALVGSVQPSGLMETVQSRKGL